MKATTVLFAMALAVATFVLQGCTIQASALYHGKTDLSRTDESADFRWRK